MAAAAVHDDATARSNVTNDADAGKKATSLIYQSYQ